MTLFKPVLALLPGVLLLSSSVFAHIAPKINAMPYKEPSVSYRWNGFYAGLNAGVVQHTMDITDNQATTFNATLRQAANPMVTGGFQAGYRRQLDLNTTSGVYGLEFSANFSNADFSKSYGSSSALYQLNFDHELKNLCLLQLMGGIASDKTLLFMSAGLSWVNITGSITNQDSIAFFDSVNLDKKEFGTAVGGGVEYAVNDKVSVRFKVDIITPNTYTASDDVGDAFLISNSIVQGTIGVNYTFG